jgi:hypothetical protein
MSKYFKVNESGLDRIVRIVVGAVLIAVWLVGIIGGVLGIVLGVVGIVLVATGIAGFCAIYTLLGISTKK